MNLSFSPLPANREHADHTFFRLDSASMMAGLREAVPELPAKPDVETVFRTLRELRNKR